MKFWYKKRQTVLHKKKIIPGHGEEASESKSLILFPSGDWTPGNWYKLLYDYATKASISVQSIVVVIIQTFVEMANIQT